LLIIFNMESRIPTSFLIISVFLCYIIVAYVYQGEGNSNHSYGRSDYIRKQLFKNRKDKSSTLEDTSFILGYGLYAKNVNSSDCEEQFYCGFIMDHDITCKQEETKCPNVCTEFLPETHKCIIKECNEEFFCCNFLC